MCMSNDHQEPSPTEILTSLEGALSKLRDTARLEPASRLCSNSLTLVRTMAGEARSGRRPGARQLDQLRAALRDDQALVEREGQAIETRRTLLAEALKAFDQLEAGPS